MKYGDEFYILEFGSLNNSINDPYVYYIQKLYYIGDSLYFNGNREVLLCSQPIEEIRQHKGRNWIAMQCARKETLKNAMDYFEGFFDNIDTAKRFAKKYLSEEKFKYSVENFDEFQKKHYYERIYCIE